jgi:hypothetical protein
VKNKVEAKNDYEFNQKIIVELRELNIEYQHTRTQDNTIESCDFEDFYDFKHKFYESLSRERSVCIYQGRKEKST